VKDIGADKVRQDLNLYEIESLRLYLEGLSTLEIAIKMKRSEFSIAFFIRSAKTKLVATNVGNSVALAIKAGFL